MDQIAEAANQSGNDGGKWLRRGFFVAIVLGCAVAISPNPADPDLWGHVRYGRDLLATGEVPETTTYSFTAEGYRWINHENLAEILLAVGADSIGPVGLLIAKCLLGVLVILLIAWFAARQGVGLVTICVVALLVATNLAYHWSVRPHILSYVYFTLMIALVTWTFRGWQDQWHLRRRNDDDRPLDYSLARLRFLWLAPVLFLFWTNSHGGFVAGFCIFAAYLGCRSLEAVIRLGRDGWPIALRLVLMIVAAGLATLINPYGPQLHAWLIESLGIPRPEITEWHPPELFTIEALELWLVLGLFAAAMLFSRKSRDFTHLVLLSITLWQSLEHLRHLPFFVILFGFWMPVHIESFLRRLNVSSDPSEKFGAGMSPIARRILTGGLGLAMALLVYRLHSRLGDLRVERSDYPVSAFQFIADHDLNGRMVVTYNWAQYAIATFAPKQADDHGILVGFDGRFRTCYPQPIIDMNFDFVIGDRELDERYRGADSPPFDSARVLRFKNPNLVLISRHQRPSVEVMKEQGDEWILLYQDSLAQLWGLRSKYDNPSSSDFIQPTDRRVSDAPQIGAVSWPASPVPSGKAQFAVN
ncbi:MAG: hypothetical protein IH991_02915 [Planctomycetes bacterium]|nr:hypothetical protein [Planctomycetota bacterium]